MLLFDGTLEYQFNVCEATSCTATSIRMLVAFTTGVKDRMRHARAASLSKKKMHRRLRRTWAHVALATATGKSFCEEHKLLQTLSLPGLHQVARHAVTEELLDTGGGIQENSSMSR